MDRKGSDQTYKSHIQSSFCLWLFNFWFSIPFSLSDPDAKDNVDKCLINK